MAPRWWWSVSTPTSKPRKKPHDDLIWLIAIISLALPFAGSIVGIVGLVLLVRGAGGGGWWLGAGALLLLLDLLSDIWLHRISRNHCDEPVLNSPAAKLIGRSAILDSEIVAGRGRLRLNGGWWMIEGPDCPAGTCVRVTGCNGSVLRVEKSD